MAEESSKDTEQKLGRDVFVALAAIGWADGKLDSDEADAIVRTALDEGLELEEICEIEAAIKSPVQIDSIDLTKMSKADRLFVYAVGTWISRIDGHLADEEKKALKELGAVLKVPEKPRDHASAIAAEVAALGESDKPAFFNLPKLRRTLKVRLAQAQALRNEARDNEASEDTDDEADEDDE